MFGALLAATCMLAAFAPRTAEACSPPEPGLAESTPADGATYPANAALLFSGSGIGLEAVTVTVDGQPAQFAVAGFASGWADIAVLVEPAPLPGQLVVISGKFCEGGGACDLEKLSYTAGAPDLIAPAPVADGSFFAVYDHADFVSSGGDCQDDRDMTLFVHVMQGADAPEEAPGVVSASWAGDGGQGGFSGHIFASGPSTQSIQIVESQLGGKDPLSEVCITVVSRDLAGNEAAPLQLCPACFFRKDDITHDEFFTPEPEWTDADAVPGSACAVAQETTGGEVTESGDSGPDSDSEPTTGGTGDSQSSGESQSSGDSQSTGESQSTGDSQSSGDQNDGDDKGCACDSDGGSRDLGALVVMALGLGLVRRRR